MTLKHESICVHCGRPSVLTRDHVPPRAYFAEPRSNDLVTVPSCAECNTGASEDDEAFLRHVALAVWPTTATTLALWDKRLRGIKRNQSLHREIVDSMVPIKIELATGERVATAAVAHDVGPIRRAIERYVRGLYFHEYGTALSSQAVVECHPVTKNHSDLAEHFEGYALRTVGNGQFAYRFLRVDEAPEHSIWLLVFHNVHAWMVFTAAPGRVPGETASLL